MASLVQVLAASFRLMQVAIWAANSLNHFSLPGVLLKGAHFQLQALALVSLRLYAERFNG
jgi:hypothetical protein